MNKKVIQDQVIILKVKKLFLQKNIQGKVQNHQNQIMNIQQNKLSKKKIILNQFQQQNLNQEKVQKVLKNYHLII